MAQSPHDGFERHLRRQHDRLAQRSGYSGHMRNRPDPPDRAVRGRISGRYAETARRRGLRRQLELALRAVPHRHRQGPAQGTRGRHSANQLQRRDSILMKTIFKAAALVLAPMTAMALTSVPAAAQSKTGIAVVDLQRTVATSSAYSTARTQIQTTYKANIDVFTARKNAINADPKATGQQNH